MYKNKLHHEQPVGMINFYTIRTGGEYSQMLCLLLNFYNFLITITTCSDCCLIQPSYTSSEKWSSEITVEPQISQIKYSPDVSLKCKMATEQLPQCIKPFAYCYLHHNQYEIWKCDVQYLIGRKTSMPINGFCKKQELLCISFMKVG